MIRRPQREGRQPPVPVTRAGNVAQGIAVLSTRSPHLGPRSLVLLRCADTAGQFGVDGDDLYANNKPERKSSQQNLATKLDRCLPRARPPQKGGVGVRLAAFSSGWNGSSNPHCVGGVVAKAELASRLAGAIS